MTAVVAKELRHGTAVSADEAVFTMTLSLAEVLIVKWYRGDAAITPAMLESALTLGKATAKPVG